jgi:hypothetical protein
VSGGPTPNPHAGGPPLIGGPRLLIQYIRSYPPYPEVVSSTHNLRTRHAMVTGLGIEADHSHSSSAEIKNAGTIPYDRPTATH